MLKIIQPYQVDLAEAFDRDLSYSADFADMMGHEHVKRAMEVAAAGGHNALMFGTKTGAFSLACWHTSDGTTVFTQKLLVYHDAVELGIRHDPNGRKDQTHVAQPGQ